MSERSNASSVYGSEHGHHSLDKSFKDLQRQTTSLERLKYLLDTEIDRSSKSVKKVFEEIRRGLDDRESKILAELDVVKKEANDMLESRHSKAIDLRRMVERAERLKEAEIADVRSQIKHFVTDRRHDEEMGRTTRFMYDSDHLLNEVQKFGEVIHIPKLVVRRTSTVSTGTNGHNNNNNNNNNNASEVSKDHNEVDYLEDRLKNNLHIQTSSAPSHQRTAMSSGPRNRGSYDKKSRGAKSPQSSRKSTPTSPPPPSSSPPSSSATPQPLPPSPQSQRPQQQRQRQRRPDSSRNRNRNSLGEGASSNSSSTVNNNRNNDNDISNNNNNNNNNSNNKKDNETTTTANASSDLNSNTDRSSNRGGRAGNRGQGRGRGSGRGRGGRGGYRGNSQQSSSSNSNNVVTAATAATSNTVQPITA